MGNKFEVARSVGFKHTGWGGIELNVSIVNEAGKSAKGVDQFGRALIENIREFCKEYNSKQDE